MVGTSTFWLQGETAPPPPHTQVLSGDRSLLQDSSEGKDTAPADTHSVLRRGVCHTQGSLPTRTLSFCFHHCYRGLPALLCFGVHCPTASSASGLSLSPWSLSLLCHLFPHVWVLHSDSLREQSDGYAISQLDGVLTPGHFTRCWAACKRLLLAQGLTPICSAYVHNGGAHDSNHGNWCLRKPSVVSFLLRCYSRVPWRAPDRLVRLDFMFFPHICCCLNTQ